MLHIIDDEEMLAEVNSDILNSAGYETDVYTNPLKYLDYLYSDNYIVPTTIFTDFQMPNMNGSELIHKVHEKNSDQRIVVLSGYNEIAEELWGKTCSFLHKPFTAKKLIAIADVTAGCDKKGVPEAISRCRVYHEGSGNGKWDCPFKSLGNSKC